MSRVRLVVSDEQKQRWSQAVEDDPAADTLSDLIRDAVEAHIARDPEDKAEDLELDPVLDELDEIQTKLYNLENSLRTFRQDTPTEDDIERLIEYYVSGVTEDIAYEIEEGRFDHY
jgi:dGTP triphosphohydrolase